MKIVGIARAHVQWLCVVDQTLIVFASCEYFIQESGYDVLAPVYCGIVDLRLSAAVQDSDNSESTWCVELGLGGVRRTGAVWAGLHLLQCAFKIRAKCVGSTKAEMKLFGSITGFIKTKKQGYLPLCVGLEFEKLFVLFPIWQQDTL